MDSDRPLVIALRDAGNCDEMIIGGKALKLAQLAAADFKVPQGFCITTWAYQSFIEDNTITATIRMELGRKSMDDMRWEEIWDAALRIRSLFLTHSCSKVLQREVDSALQHLDTSKPIAVRSSSPSEDAAGTSFAGLHESIVGVTGKTAVLDAVRLVWASLWSDAALLYRRELQLDPEQSRMAVLVQEMVSADRSGVAFGCDPRTGNRDLAIIESVPGPCSLLVDGLCDPDRWKVDRESRKVLEWFAGERDLHADKGPLLAEPDVLKILDTLLSIEHRFQWTPDMEWSGRSESLTVLQARPVTTGTPDTDETRQWYLTLRPSDARLRKARRRVAEELIPQLEAEGRELAAMDLDACNDRQLAEAIEQRYAAVEKWKKIYWDEFIPFAHGVRRLATYYNDAVRPEDPYEFVALLQNQPLIAVQRNKAIAALANEVRLDKTLHNLLDELLTEHAGALDWNSARDMFARTSIESIARFVCEFERLTERYLDIVYDEVRLYDTTESLLRNILELARVDGEPANSTASSNSVKALEQRLLAAVGNDRHDEAKDVIDTGRVSWKLRDDDNLLVARLESQLLRALEIGVERLRVDGRIEGKGRPAAKDAESIARCLRDTTATPIQLHASPAELTPSAPSANAGETPRQLVGQPASSGVATGSARLVQGSEDLGKFRRGEVLVCDAIQPTMTHLVPLASAIVERRGGMLIHGAIIARELGIPCVNGVRNATDRLANGDLVTVDGHLGIVTLGSPEFDLELRLDISQARKRVAPVTRCASYLFVVLESIAFFYGLQLV